MRDPADWLVVCFFILLAIGLSGCSQLRHLTMTEDEMRYYGSLKVTDWCGRQPDHVCIRE